MSGKRSDELQLSASCLVKTSCGHLASSMGQKMQILKSVAIVISVRIMFMRNNKHTHFLFMYVCIGFYGAYNCYGLLRQVSGFSIFSVSA